MGLYDDITLFEIPIYSMDEPTYRSKWADTIEKWKNDFMNASPYNTQKLADESYLTQQYKQKMYSWKYNQIIGYITVNVWRGGKDISFNVFKPFGRKYYRHDAVLQDWKKDGMLSGMHFRIDAYKDRDLTGVIKEWVSCLANEYAKGRLYVDTSLFEAQIYSIDLMHLIKVRMAQSKP